MIFDKNKKMNRITMKHMIILITYTVFLVLLALNLNSVFATIRKVLSILKPFIYGIAMAFIFNLPLKMFMNKLSDGFGKWKKPLAVMCSVLLILGIFTFIIWIVVPQVIDSVNSLIQSFPGYVEQAQTILDDLTANGTIPSDIVSKIDAYAQDIMNAALNFVSNGLPKIINWASDFASSVKNVVLGLVIAVYITISKEKLMRQLKEFLFAFTSTRIYDFLIKVGRLTNETFSGFVNGQLMEACIIGILCYIGCLILRFPYAPIVSVIMGCTNIIPIFGAIMGVMIGTVLVALVDPMQGVFFVIFGICLQQFESNLIYPRVVGNQVGLSGLWVLLAITVGGDLFGAIGMILGLPVFSVIYTLLRELMHARASQKRELLKLEQENKVVEE